MRKTASHGDGVGYQGVTGLFVNTNNSDERYDAPWDNPLIRGHLRDLERWARRYAAESEAPFPNSHRASGRRSSDQ